uniref:Vacuolar protein-sorting-associated protein 25 n=1 Tax=Spongospora subterranea TaxID=70186 RepID=A0A0H5QH89_9EUKA|eukprot:CRZ01333.1 hypothetical protein [Spongospora subterranea]
MAKENGPGATNMISFPPFYTLQPVLATRQKQLSMWIEVVLEYVERYKRPILYAEDKAESETPNLFYNPAINRRLSREGIQAVLEAMVANGNAIWRDASRSAVLVSAINITELSQILYQWAKDAGQLNDICTIYELHSGDHTVGHQFHGLDGQLLLASIQMLADKGQATVIPASSSDETGVKFLDT